MAGLAGYKATVTIYGTGISEVDDVDIEFARDDIDVTDLGDYIKQHAAGPVNIAVTGSAKYLTKVNALMSKLHTTASTFVSGAIKVVDPKGSTVLSGTGHWLDGGMRLPMDAITQPFRFVVNAVSVP